MTLKNSLLILINLLNINILTSNSTMKIHDSTNILIYKDIENDSSLLLQLIAKYENTLYVKSCEIIGQIKVLKTLKFSTLDSILNSQLIYKNVEPNFKSLILDTLIITYDSVFFANNSVFSLKNQLFYIKFNTLEIADPYTVHDLYSIFILKVDSSKSNVKFWNSDGLRSFSFPFYIYNRSFWYIAYCKNEFTNNCFLLNSLNGIDVENTSIEIFKRFQN